MRRLQAIFSLPSVRRWPQYSRLFLLKDRALWVLSEEARALNSICNKLGCQVADTRYLPYAKKQAVFHFNRYELFFSDYWERSSHRLATVYYHGMPGCGEPAFDKSFDGLCRMHQRLDRIQVTNNRMKELILSSGIDPAKVFLIPIGVDSGLFRRPNAEQRQSIRARLGIPDGSIVIGSFQKDGCGWGEGNEPKMVKGPDVFLKAIELLRENNPHICVLLTGPSRGFVMNGLKRLGIEYKHIFVERYEEMADIYHALDIYIVASREEGGPKAVLEAMASGVPLVSTRVGQAVELVEHCVNGWIVDLEDAEGLAHWAGYIIYNQGNLEQVLDSARNTAEMNCLDDQLPLWRNFMNGFVEGMPNSYPK
ncbi:MAG: glycosyltransferase [Candidatus Alcyoniella australis]|nr:glycosyltransferase [Candidatus Alcyoniella australis]